MVYKRRQKEIERTERSRRRDFKRITIANDLHSVNYRQRIVPNKKKSNTSKHSNTDYE